MRLIDADALKYRRKDYGGYDDVGADERKRGILYLFEEDIAAAPTIDAVEVVRCGDCKYYDETGWGFGFCYLEKWGESDIYPFTPPSVSQYGFCKWGDRREEDDNEDWYTELDDPKFDERSEE